MAASQSPKPLRIVDYEPGWVERFQELGGALRAKLGDAAMRIDHIGSTSVPGLAAKDVIDIQITVVQLRDALDWPDELLPGVPRKSDPYWYDHVPPGERLADGESERDAAGSDDGEGGPEGVEWRKVYWSASTVHVHVREQGRANQRYALLFRDYLRADSMAAGAYAEVKRALTTIAPEDFDAYYAVKDPGCDLIMAGAEQWARLVRWSPGRSDA